MCIRDRPSNTLLRWGHGVYFDKIVPKIGALLSDPSAYSYLPKSVDYLPDSETLLSDLQMVGFSDATQISLSGGITQIFLGTQKL